MSDPIPDPTAPSLAGLAAEIADDLDRPDLDAQIRRAIAAAIRRHEGARLGFNETILTFVTVPTADVYAGGDAPALPDLLAIDSVVLVDGDDVAPLVRVPETWIETADCPASPGRPSRYSYFGRSLRLWPVPSDVWTVRVSAHVRLTVPSSADGPCAWYDQGRDLIGARAKAHLALHVLKDASLAAAMAAAEADALAALRGRANRIASSGAIAAWDV